MVLAGLLVLNGLLLLPLAAEWLVLGAVAIARRLNVSELLIGLTIVALGTSAPELVTAINAALAGESGIVFGNVIGSNIANLGLVLGLAAVLGRIPISKAVFWLDGPLMVGATLVAYWLICDGTVDMVDGYILLGWMALLITFDILRGYLRIFMPVDKPAEVTKESQSNTDSEQSLPLLPAIGVILLGLLGLIYGAELLVRGASELITMFHISGTFIGATVIALGTSAPELAATIAAVRHRRHELVMGNLLGSCRFNLLLILGVPALITTLHPDPSVIKLHLPALIIVSLATWLFLMFGKTIRRREGVILLLLYLAYLFFVWQMRGSSS